MSNDTAYVAGRTDTLSGRVAIVTGASRGIGAATARAIGAAGGRVVLAARSAPALGQIAEELTNAGVDALAVPTDVTESESVRRLVEQTLAAYGRLDIAVNNAAGGGHPPTALAEVAIEDYDSALAVTLRGVFLAMKYEIPAILDSGGGSIVNMSSTAGLQPVGGLAGYVSAKFGVIGLTRSAALDYAAHGIRVNALAPGTILTEQLEHAGKQAQDQAAASLPTRRLGRPEEVAAAAVWLCSDEASFVTGTTLTIDGGMLAGMAPFSQRSLSEPATPEQQA
jgi:NAD(P)-dependent dehydrogenase (short-subunit alcohol dehydrogenase family)